MAIPVIRSYPMPLAADLPATRVSWKPEPGRSALLIHDMQNYFLRTFEKDTSPLSDLLVNIRVLKERCRELGIPVIYSAQPGGQSLEQRGLLQDFWGSGIPEGEEPERIVDELAPSADDILLTKWRYSAFQKTELYELLQEQGRDQLLICGVYAHIGCMLTASEAFMKDIQPFLIADSVADFSQEHHEMAITYAADRCAVVMSTADLLETLGFKAASKADTELPLTEESIRMQIAELLQIAPSEISNEDNLLDLGLDSIRIMSLVESWRRAGIEITFVELAENPTIAYWCSLVCQARETVPPNADYLS
ncbi:isochorismatase [Paenibacillus sambharensis]|uniref:isochorismatase n=1 Tax=Paenibacillus sambharensis TaxID=1803190 RepID=A0A2W1LV02_9BACL|nr:isochorismatase family protein [Paenibacillus sambharensis]PZD95337.1 isochorismatase [Paenibacillus sambharensis]